MTKPTHTVKVQESYEPKTTPSGSKKITDLPKKKKKSTKK